MYKGRVSKNRCESFWLWLFYSWDFPVGWSGPYIKNRIAGHRIFGFEFERPYQEMAE